MSVYELLLWVNLLIMAVLVYKIFSFENVIVYNGIKYPVKYDFASGRISCRLFGGVKRFIRNDNRYNVFGNLVEVE